MASRRPAAARRWMGAGLVAIALVAAACGSANPSAPTSGSGSTSGHTVKIGAVFSLTGIGAPYGPQQERGARLAVDTVNAGGLSGGAKLVLNVVDDASDPSKSAAATRQLIDSGALALIGPTLTNSVPSVHPVAANAHVPMLAVSTTGLGIVGPSCAYCAGWIFRDSLGESAAVPVNIHSWTGAGITKTAVVLVSDDDKFSADDASIFHSAAPTAGIDVIGNVAFPKATPDPTSYVNKALEMHPNALFIASVGTIVSKVMVEARAQGFTGQFLGGNAFNSPAVSQAAGTAGEGAQSASAWYLGNTDPANSRFVSAFAARYGIEPDQFAAQAYTGVLILAEAIRHAGLGFASLSTDRSRLRGAMQSVQIDSPLGPFRFTADHDVEQTIWVVAMDGKGGFRLVASIPSGSGQ